MQPSTMATHTETKSEKNPGTQAGESPRGECYEGETTEPSVNGILSQNSPEAHT